MLTLSSLSITHYNLNIMMLATDASGGAPMVSKPALLAMPIELRFMVYKEITPSDANYVPKIDTFLKTYSTSLKSGDGHYNSLLDTDISNISLTCK